MTRDTILKVAKPILFNSEMVRAILYGVGGNIKHYKTCTRRIMKPQPKESQTFILGWCTASTEKKDIGCLGIASHELGGDTTYFKPKYHVGDLLYVRETWNYYKSDTNVYDPEENIHREGYIYKASPETIEDMPEFTRDIWEYGEGRKWCPSIHMPKEAARIFLRVKGVRAERLQEIDGQGVLKEGVNTLVHPEADYFNTNQCEAFVKLWNSTIKKEDLDKYGWDANPWVWVYEFERVEVEP